MDKNEVYYRIKRILIVILICMIVISFVGLFTLSSKLEDNIQVVDVLTDNDGTEIGVISDATEDSAVFFGMNF